MAVFIKKSRTEYRQAIRRDASGDRINRSSNLPASTSFTMCGWFKKISDRGAVEERILGAVSSGWSIRMGWTGTSPFEFNFDANTDTVSFTEPVTGEWFFAAMGRWGTGTDESFGFIGYSNGTYEYATASMSETDALTNMEFLSSSNTEWVDGLAANCAIWNVGLSEKELLQVFRKNPLIIKRGLISYYPFDNHAKDIVKGINIDTLTTISYEPGFKELISHSIYANVLQDVRFRKMTHVRDKEPPAPIEVDWSNSLTTGLQICLPFNSGNVLQHNLGAWQEMQLDVINTTAAIGHDQRGSFLNCANAVDSVKDDTAVDPGSLGDIGSYLMGWMLTNSAGLSRAFGTGADFECVLKQTSGLEDSDMWVGGNNVSLPGGVNQGIYYITGRTVADAGSGNGLVRIYHKSENGAPTEAGNYTSTLLTPTNSDFTVGNVTPAGSEGLIGRIYFVYLWNRTLDEKEMFSLMNNPWQIFKPKEIYIPSQEKLPDLAKFEIEQTSYPWRP